LSALRAAERQDPRSDEIVFSIGETLCLLRRYDDAARYLDRTIFLSPRHNWAHVQKALLALSWRGDKDGASRALADGTAELHAVEVFDPWSFGMWPALVRTLAEFDPVMLGGFAAEAFSGDSGSYYLFRGSYHRNLRQAPAARAYFDSARVVLERRSRTYPEDDLVHSQLAIAYLGLGRGEAAMHEATMATGLLPVTDDAFFGPVHLQTLTQVYIETGDLEAAIEQLDRLLAAPGYVSAALLQVDPLYAPLRKHPRFQALLDRYAN